MKPEIKKQIILHLPYLAFIYLFGKVGQAFRLAQGADISAKLLHIGQGFSAAFASAAPSFHPTDLLIGLAAAVIIRLVVYSKQKNAKKYRKGMEYGTARWGTAADIKPFIDPVFDNNVLLTATERLMMSNRPKDPKNARNKNILVIGGSGSGKTRFFCKPNIMQLHSSYVITDPKGSLICEVGQLLQRAKYRIAVLNTINFSKSISVILNIFGIVALTTITLFLSAQMSSPVTALITSCVICFLPVVFDFNDSLPVLQKMQEICPIFMLHTNGIFSDMKTYFGMSQPVFMIILNVGLIFVFYRLTKNISKKHQVTG